ncbi:MAG TPA: hypothetical protein VFG37_11185 [Planctomycetota bacterium]|nr:hypothetical protein [Planctomycetota bacterium]
MVMLKLHVDRWDDERAVLPFLKSISPRQSGPDGALLTFSFNLVKHGKRKPFLLTEWQLELETKVRSLVVARWVLDRMSEVSDVQSDQGSKKGLDDIGLALRIEEATKLLDRGPASDPPGDDGDDSSADRTQGP